MKRALFVYLAVLAVLLVYPSTDLLAKSPKSSDYPTIIIVPPTIYAPGPNDYWGTGGEDDGGDPGDADDLAGTRGGKPVDRNFLPGFGDARIVLKVWWLYFFHRIF
ncbi:MAG: hypothetical protein GTO51_01050 [Candidatus Latescibacteria bacterium]|nr:hypothetical protein [Candidatus Latescibacterota bacterium]NIM21586.1 hypothetical protein [Candidatus Latescibacterota bacterium]NIM64565.1 hypothetical protein [Candidatus Latescibacterota bacterium]NIO01080.1 hypothetical protein [Candidatus Latescibacterota bacterium]NIO27473.1 hypothetical protein [Candidatus Latescibacterota bacterium]